MKHIILWMLVCVCAFARLAPACPNCRDAIAVSGEQQQDQQGRAAQGGAEAKTDFNKVTMGQGINLTIVLAIFMLSAMVFGIIKFMIAAHREEELALRVRHSKPAEDPSTLS